MATSTTAPVVADTSPLGVFWDIDNCPVSGPHPMNLTKLEPKDLADSPIWNIFYKLVQVFHLSRFSEV